MNAGMVHARGALALLLLAGATLSLLAITLAGSARRVTIGGEIVWDDFGVRWLGVETAGEIGMPADGNAEVGRLRLVRLEVLDETKCAGGRLESARAALIDTQGEDHDADVRATQAWKAASASRVMPGSIAPDETRVLDLVYGVSPDVRGLTLRIRWDGSSISSTTSSSSAGAPSSSER